MLRKTILLTILTLCFISSRAVAQENVEKLTIKVGGYIRTETFFDTYRSTESRDGESYSYPLKKSLDAAGNDINKINQFTMLGVQSRFKINASGVSAFGAKVSSLIEADFLGMGDDSKYMVGLRHAYFKLDWNKTQLLMGQYWSPMSIAEFAANTVLFASGTTFQPLNRSIQIRLTYQAAPKLKLSGAILGYTTHRPVEIKNNNSQRNAGLPDFQAQLQYGSVSEFFFAFTGGYKFLKPYLETVVGNSKYKATKVIGSYNFQACVGYQFSNLSIKWQGNLGQNMTNYGMIGGYLPVEGSANAQGEYDYANIKTVSTWIDIETKGTKFKPGLFVGYSENLGTDKDVVSNASSIDACKADLCRGADIRKLYRISPRFYYISGPIDVGVEYIVMGAAYGTFRKQSVKDTQDPSVNNRFLVSVRYTF